MKVALAPLKAVESRSTPGMGGVSSDREMSGEKITQGCGENR